MFNLYQIVTGAQGGQALDNLARQYGLSREQADNAVKALVPALSTAFMTKIAHPGGLPEVAGAMNDAQHRQAYADPNMAQTDSTTRKGNDVAGSIFGSGAVLDQVIAQAAKYTGIAPDTIRQMLPVIVSIVLGGVATAMHNQGLGGLLGQLANSGLGGGFGGQAAPSGPGQPGGGLGGVFGNILSGMFGGRHSASQPGPQPNAGQPNAGWPQNPAASGLPPAMQAGMEALGKMFQPGVHPSAGQPNDLGAQIGAIFGDRKA